MYEKNTLILNEMAKKNDFGNQRIARDMKDMYIEEDRVLYLKKIFNEYISRFETIQLWDGEAPGTCMESGYEYQNQPQIAYFPGKGKRSRSVVIVAPGGGFNVKSISFEGFPIVHKLNEHGIDAAILDYRLKPYPVTVSLLDMQRAIRTVRSNAEILDISPDKIAVHGSSAGGMLSALSAVHYDHGHKESGDPIEQVSCRPDGVILSYGAFSLTVPLQEGLGSILADPDIREKHYSSPDKFVTPDTPPFFMWQTPDEDDPRLMCNMVRALTEAGVRCEAHLFPFGPHGTGMADGQNPMNYNDTHVARWSDLAIEWLKLYGF